MNYDHIEMDRHRLEYVYRDHGFLMAKVLKVDVLFSDDKHDVTVAFHIQEGSPYHVRTIDIAGDDVVSDREVKSHISIEEGRPYSQSEMMKSINKLKDAWG